jgi:polysaccharide biosynthesis/export protein
LFLEKSLSKFEDASLFDNFIYQFFKSFILIMFNTNDILKINSGMQTFILLLLLLLVLPEFQIAQTNPDYKERSFQTLKDSLKMLTATGIGEAAIDPNEYRVGPGENIFISISGIEETNFNLVVNIENYLFVPKVGGINLKGLTLNQAREKIRLTLEKYYKNVEIFISLANLKKIKVFLVGDVQKPASVIIESNAKLLDLLLNSAGLNPTSSFRNIQIKDVNGQIKYYDFLIFLRYGDKKNNPLLNDGDVVFVDKLDKVVTISGPVKFPATYEFLEGESVADLIKLAGGFLFNAKTDSIEIVRYDKQGNGQTSYYYSYQEIIGSNMLLNFKDNVIVRIIPQFYIDNFVRIEGWVKYPGVYKINEDQTKLSAIIKEAGGFRKDASIKDASLSRTTGDVDFDPEYERLKLILRADMTDDEYDYLKAKSRQRKGKVVVDFEELFLKNNLTEDVVLKRGDVIYIPETKNYVILLGQVVNPGNIVYNENYTVDDYIRLAGGFGWRAIEGDVRVIKSTTGEWIDDEDVESIGPGDTIWVPENPPGPKFWDVFTSILLVLGQAAAVVAATVAVIVATR